MRIGRYDVTGEVGRGGMGVVLRGRSPDGRDVAIKVLGREKRDALARFQREGRLLSALGEAQGFVPCLELGESPGGPFIVMPFLDGGTLRERMREPLAVEDALALSIELATAAGRAHERGIVHRDLKPENILFTRRGAESDDWGRALVTDLGLARHYDRAVLDGSQSCALSRPGEARGTAGYMAPEQLNDARDALPSADVFALGAILYECVTGAPALGGGSVLEQFGRAESGRIKRPSEHRPELPRWLDRVILRALSFEPRRRYADGHAFARALRDRGARSKKPFAALAALALVAVFVAVLVARRPERPSAERAVALLKANDVEGGLLEAQRAIDADPRSAPAYVARGEARFMKRENARAKADFDKATELDPRLAVAWTRRGQHAIRTDDARRGIADFTRALELDPYQAEALHGRARILSSEGDLPRARADLDRAIEVAPQHAAFWNLRGAVRGISGDVDGCLADLDKAIALDPTVAEFYANRAGAWFRKNDFDRSEADANRALALDPRETNALGTRAGIWINRGDRADEGLADLNRVLSINPRSETGFINRAAYYIRKRVDVQNAVDDLRRAGAIAPRNRYVWSNLAVACEMTGDKPGVAEAMDRFLELIPGDLEMHLNRATVRISLKDFRGAEADATLHVDALPALPMGWRVRGVARMEQGDTAGAIADFEKFLALAPDHEDAPSVKKRLARLGR